MSARLFVLASDNAAAATVSPWGFPMRCTYEYDAGELPIFWPTELAHPGSPPNAQLLSCSIGGVDVTDMLKEDQRERIEEAILEQLED